MEFAGRTLMTIGLAYMGLVL